MWPMSVNFSGLLLTTQNIIVGGKGYGVRSDTIGEEKLLPLTVKDLLFTNFHCGGGA